MIGLVISDSFILSVSWDDKRIEPTISNINMVPFNESISGILFDESSLNLVLSSVLKKINQHIPFHGKNISVAIIDDLVHHSIIQSEIDLSDADKFKYINWVDNLKSNHSKTSTLNFAQTYSTDLFNSHVCTVSKVLIRTLKLSLVEMGGNPFWMGPASTLYLDDGDSKDSSIIYRNGNKYFFLKVKENRFDLGEVSFSGGLPKIRFSSDPNSNLILKSFGLDTSEIKKIPIYCPQKLGRNAAKAWENADLHHGIPFENFIVGDQQIDNIPHLEGNLITKLIGKKDLKSSFNFFESPGLTHFNWKSINSKNDAINTIDTGLTSSRDINENDDFVGLGKNRLNSKDIKIDNDFETDLENSVDSLNPRANKKLNSNSSQSIVFAILMIIGAFIFINYLKIQSEMNSSNRDEIEGFSVELIENTSNKNQINSSENSKDLLMQSKSISSALLSLLAETEINRFNTLTITKSFLGMEYLSGTNPNIENILGISPSSFSVEAIGKDSTTFLWYYSFDLPLLKEQHIEGDISKIKLIENLHTKLSDKPQIRYFEKIYTKYQIYGPMLIWIKNKADILEASSIFSNMDDSILLRKFVLFNESDRPNPRAGFYVSILED